MRGTPPLVVRLFLLFFYSLSPMLDSQVLSVVVRSGNAMVEEMKSLSLKVDSARPSLNQPMPEASPDASPVPSRDQSPRPVVCRWDGDDDKYDDDCYGVVPVGVCDDKDPDGGDNNDWQWIG